MISSQLTTQIADCTTSQTYTSFTCKARKSGKVVEIQAEINPGGTFSADTVLAVIPEGYRPHSWTYVCGTNGPNVVRLELSSNGNIKAVDNITSYWLYFAVTYVIL